MSRFRIFFSTLVFLLAALGVRAQAENEMADAFRADGKIYVLVAIILIVLAGLIFYLFTLDRKVSRLERDLGQDDKNQRTK